MNGPHARLSAVDASSGAVSAELNRGFATLPRRAATVLLLRGGAERLEVLLVQRHPAARFVGGAWVFPGGSVDPADGDGQVGLRAAAIREVQEETGIALGPEAELIPFARWITPPQIRTRFDTWFYVTQAPADAVPTVDGAEVVDFRWVSPRDALAAGEANELLLVLPTVRQLEQVAEYASVELLIEHARGREVRPVQPRILTSGNEARIVLPGEPGYES